MLYNQKISWVDYKPEEQDRLNLLKRHKAGISQTCFFAPPDGIWAHPKVYAIASFDHISYRRLVGVHRKKDIFFAGD